jgi:hypothetical protein
MPGIDSKLRWASAYACGMTALCAPFRRIDAVWNNTATAGTALPATDMFAAVFRNAECLSIIYYGKPQFIQYVLYGWYGDGSGIPERTRKPPATDWTVYIENKLTKYPLNIPYAKLDTNSAAAPHGTLLLGATPDGIQNTDGRRFFWLDKGMDVDADMVSDVDGHFRLSVDRWTNQGIEVNAYDSEIVIGALTSHSSSSSSATPKVKSSSNLKLPRDGGSGTFNFTITQGGYYAFVIENLDSAGATILLSNFSFSGTVSCFGHQCAKDFEKNVGSASSIRINAASIMYTNTAPKFFREGKVVGYQVPQGDDWKKWIDISDTGSAMGAVEKTADKGIYGFLKSTQPEDFKMAVYTHVDTTGAILDSFRPLNQKSAFLVVNIRCTVATTVTESTSLAQDGYWTISSVMEYETSDSYRDVAHPTFTEADYKLGAEYAGRLVQWHENPMHIKDLWGAITKGARNVFNGIVQYAPKVAKVVSTIGEAVGMFAPMLL